MCHQHQRAGEFHQAVFQHIERRNVQVVRRFVKNQEVGRLQHQPCDEETCLFASGEAGDREIQLLRPEEEPFRPGDEMHRAVLIDDRVAVRGEGSTERGGLIQ